MAKLSVPHYRGTPEVRSEKISIPSIINEVFAVCVGGEGSGGQELLVRVLEEFTGHYEDLLVSLQERYKFQLDQVLCGRLDLLKSKRHRKEVRHCKEVGRREEQGMCMEC